MKVLISAVAFSTEMSGVQRHAFNVVRCLLTRSEISEIHLVVAPWQYHLMKCSELDRDSRFNVHIATMNKNAIGRNLWHYRQLPYLATDLRVDLVHLSYPVPVDATALSCPVIVSLHDLYPYEIPRNFGFPQIIFNRLILQQCLRSVNAIACVSDTTIHRLEQYTSPAVRRKAVRIYNCIEAPAFNNLSCPIPGWREEPFLLCVAQHRRNKNIPLLLQAFRRLLLNQKIDEKTQLVIIGIEGPESRRIRQLVFNGGLAQKVHFFEGLSEPELQWCYTRCEALVAPSRTEGFGLPVAEGLMAGCRVVCSDISAFREVGNDHCYFVQLGRNAEMTLAESIVTALQSLVKQPVSLPQFSPSVIAEQYIGLYRRLMTHASGIQHARLSSFQTAATERRP